MFWTGFIFLCHLIKTSLSNTFEHNWDPEYEVSTNEDTKILSKLSKDSVKNPRRNTQDPKSNLQRPRRIPGIWIDFQKFPKKHRITQTLT